MSTVTTNGSFLENSLLMKHTVELLHTVPIFNVEKKKEKKNKHWVKSINNKVVVDDSVDNRKPVKSRDELSLVN